MFIRAYLRASTKEQDASRALESLESFARDHGQVIACKYVENASGAVSDRPQLRRMLDDAGRGDVILVESIDRLSRMTDKDWQALRGEISTKGLKVVALDLPTSHAAMTARDPDDFTSRMLEAINAMMLDMMAAIARKDYEQRRERQRQGIDKAQREGRYRGRPVNHDMHDKVAKLLANNFSIRQAAETAGCSVYTVQKVKNSLSK